jgi:hypothetical protein
MFHQNSNDLVKNASVRSGHIQNSSGTRETMMKDTPSGPLLTGNDDASVSAGEGSGSGSGANASLSIGAKFQNMIQGVIDSVSLKEGLATPGGPAGAGGYSGADVEITKKENDEWSKQQLDHIERSENIMKLINTADKNTRKQWVEVTDSAGVTKYGYITKDGIFQIWSAPASPISTGWFQTDKMKQNSNVLGCPAADGSIKKHKIAGTWDTIKPFDMVYASDDNGRKNPLFLLVNDAVRDPKNSVRGMGLFSCDNERGNVYVSQRPSADFKITTDGEVGAVQMGCYVIADNVKDSDLTNRGFTFQTDLTEASISQCKRRAEDLGSSYFLVASPPNENKPKNRGGCWIYTRSGKPHINGILTLDEKGSKCHKVENVEIDEDGYMKAYTPSNLPRLYGKEATVEIPINPPNPTCNHKTNDKCIFPNYKRAGDTCYPPNGSGSWAYSVSGLASYGNNDLNGWLNALHSRNGDGIERGAVNEYIERCKNTKGYEFLDPTPSPPRTKIERSVALYSLKTGGPTGVDTTDRNGRGYIGRIAYIDHNGERHDYPASALSFMAPSTNAKGETQPASYVNLGGYDTRSAESSYALKEITPGSSSSITASMEKCRGMCDADEKCGGFVYTKSGSSTDGKCELKDRAKMYPVGLRVADQTKELMLKVPTINGTIGDDACKVGNGAYTIIDSAQYAHYPDTGAMTAGTKCDVKNLIPKKGSLEAPDLTAMFGARDAAFAETQDKIDEYRAQTTVSESFTGLREGMRADISGGNYADSMKDIQRDLTKIANSEYQRERLLAITEETNKVLISESYKFILWSILAILAVMALLKLKEMFGQDDVEAGDGGDGSGGLFAYILGLFGIGSVKTDDIADRTGDVKDALSSAGAQLKEAGEKLTTGITEGADNLVSSANEAAAGAIEGAKGLADKVSETATDAVNKVGDAVGSTGATAPAPSGAATGAGTGGRRHARTSGKK